MANDQSPARFLTGRPRLAEEHAGEIRLLETDVIMPGMNGRELAAKVREALQK